ncbi:unnamed protein product (macronuclear) [Paramecium tetraurelia]|uniref:Mitochondrial import inner membrane translocase subunit TIM50 n=1 Tax=Paramecium tetraurelia TaxID=5888 RepID=A0BX31_PARTE|nr:uncharacterized protein GSPATT00032950001 [Paramecium tetraurelia]CAK63098.1 unnamed protein product [Paramecium tetraurelia]|eukprot:XP_001430496.1 hypothetical protein (macronuclear) [Paramecium tetraurelia strain d4-2]
MKSRKTSHVGQYQELIVFYTFLFNISYVCLLFINSSQFPYFARISKILRYFNLDQPKINQIITLLNHLTDCYDYPWLTSKIKSNVTLQIMFRFFYSMSFICDIINQIMFGYILAWLCQFIDKTIRLVRKTIRPKKKFGLGRYQEIPRSNSSYTGRLKLLIGLEGTLVCTSHSPVEGWNKIIIQYHSGLTQDFYVKHRPLLDHFLCNVSQIYDVSIYTTQIKEFAAPIIDQFCIQFSQNFYRQKQILFFTQSCVISRNKIRKEINMTTSNPHNVIFVDYDEDQCLANSENAYQISKYNGQDNDTELLKLQDFLIKAESQMKVRKELDPSVTIQDILLELAGED